MRLTDSKRRKPWLLIILSICIVAILVLGFCEFQPTQQTNQKTIVYETD